MLGQRPQYNRFLDWAERVAAIGLGAFVVVTSLLGIALGVNAGEGWLAIVYGGLGVSMGAAGIAALRTTGARRGALLGWFLIGLASRAIVEGDLYFSFISIPIATALLAALAYDLIRRRSAAANVGAAAGGGLALFALVALAIVAPSFPTICQPLPASWKSEGFILYPGNTPPFDAAERSYDLRCLTQVPPKL